MKQHYLALVFIGGGNSHAIRPTKEAAIMAVLQEVRFAWSGLYNLDDAWITINLYDASKHENFTWSPAGVWGCDADKNNKEDLYEAGLKLPEVELKVPKLRKNGSIWSRTYENKLRGAIDQLSL